MMTLGQFVAAFQHGVRLAWPFGKFHCPSRTHRLTRTPWAADVWLYQAWGWPSLWKHTVWHWPTQPPICSACHGCEPEAAIALVRDHGWEVMPSPHPRTMWLLPPGHWESMTLRHPALPSPELVEGVWTPVPSLIINTQHLTLEQVHVLCAHAEERMLAQSHGHATAMLRRTSRVKEAAQMDRARAA